MKANYKKEQEINFAEMTLVQFANYYNKNIPASFPRATKEALEEFKIAHAGLFDAKGLWTIDKHRRRLMDWLPSFHSVV
ncbi:MAG: hypothetical protein WC385_02445 [Candidatus Paceibacterota bacterium]|jgi:hypothetical protein